MIDSQSNSFSLKLLDAKYFTWVVAFLKILDKTEVWFELNESRSEFSEQG